MSLSNIGTNLIRSETINGITEQVWEVPAFREQGAIRKARAGGEIKGLADITVQNVEEVGSGKIPGQSLFRVTIEAPR